MNSSSTNRLKLREDSIFPHCNSEYTVGWETASVRFRLLSNFVYFSSFSVHQLIWVIVYGCWLCQKAMSIMRIELCILVSFYDILFADKSKHLLIWYHGIPSYFFILIYHVLKSQYPSTAYKFALFSFRPNRQIFRQWTIFRREGTRNIFL